MAIPINFDGRDVILPGSYSVIKSGIGNRFRDLSYGRVLIIDTGAGANFGGGSGVDGEGESGIGSVYRFSDNIVYRNFLKGGLFWDLSNPLFYPEIGVNGVSEVLHVKAAKTTSATITLTFTNGSFVFKTVDEGLWSNGEIDNTVLTKGYAVKLETSREDTSKYILKFYRGSFKGEDSNGIPYDGVKKADSKPIVILESDQFSSLDELNSWMVKNSTFNGLFKDVSYTKKSTGEVVSGDAVSLSNLQLAVGGTETYDSASLDKVFEAIADLDFSFILCDKWGDDSITANNTKILAHIEDSDTRFKKIMFVGGGKDKTKFSGSGNTSISIAEYFDSQSVVVVHGDCYIKSDFVGEGMLRKPSIYTAALALGRTAGLPPQIPITFKSLMVNKVEHSLSKTERRLALKKGVLAVIYDGDLK